MLLLGVCVSITMAAEPLILMNDALQLTLGLSHSGIPVILEASWKDAGKPFLSHLADTDDALLTDLLPESLLTSRPHLLDGAPWKQVDGGPFLRAECERKLARDVSLTCVVELAKQGSLVRLHSRITNRGTDPCPVELFPIWTARWSVPGIQAVRGWRALSFAPVEKPLKAIEKVSWGSRLHSSDTPDGGMNPYWMLKEDQGYLYFALEWCGGWCAKISGDEAKLDMKAFLPQDETQLVMAPGESIDGPALMMIPVRETDEACARAEWMRQRAGLAKNLYGGPAPAYPFTYNNWYTTRFNVDAAFLKRQVADMDPYSFDAFIVDAGWYECVGKWTPHPGKFAQGEFEEILRSVKAKGVLAGIWTCPQFVNAPKEGLPPEVDQPPTFEKFIDGYLLDLAGSGYVQKLVDHVAMLRERYGAQWWKYDQLLFAAKTRAGLMRNVIAFQDALKAVRVKNPGLVIENCQSGGRMTNEVTVLATQSQWLRDGGNTGLEHARDNISVALGALEFLFPWTANRWTNNPDRMDPNDDELLRYYCRSAMAGTWGLVADLDNIGQRQRNVILKEVAIYRHLNELKPDYLYDIALPKPGAATASITFYDRTRTKAAAIIYRWDAQGAFDPTHRFRLIDPKSATCRIEDVDTGQVTQRPAALLNDEGLQVSFPPERRSAIIFVSADAKAP